MSDEVHVPSPDILERLVRVEDAAQEFRFVHLVKSDAQTAGLGVLYAQQQRLQQEVVGFRAEVAVELESLKTEQGRQGKELDAMREEQARQGRLLEEMSAGLAEVLKRLG